MGGLWTRDRWLKLLKDPARRSDLSEAGIKEEFLDMGNFERPESPQWRALLDSRTTVIVGKHRDRASGDLTREAVFDRGCNVVGIDLEADDLATVHRRKNLETEPRPETEPITIKKPKDQREYSESVEGDTEGKITIPEGRRPGGPEAW